MRSPREFADGHVPGAVNLPLLDDEQRAAVGIAYKRAGAARGPPGGHGAGQPRPARVPAGAGCAGPLAADGPPAGHHVLAGRRAQPERGAAAGPDRRARRPGGRRLPRPTGGGCSTGWRPGAADRPVFTLYGHTGAGQERAPAGAGPVCAAELRPPGPWSIDLEGLALHRGSLLGGLNQPGRADARRTSTPCSGTSCAAPRADYLVLEGEGGKIGDIFLPGRVAGRSVPAPARCWWPHPWTGAGRAHPARSTPRTGWDAERPGAVPAQPGAHRRPRCRARAWLPWKRPSKMVDLPTSSQGLLVEYYDPLYQRSCVEGRQFVLDPSRPAPTPQETRAVSPPSMARLMREAYPDRRPIVPEIGNTLREARIRKGLSIKDVEDATKIRSKYLEALEEDDFEVLPGPTFVKGFLRTYAVFLKLDADAAGRRVPVAATSPQPEQPAVPAPTSRQPAAHARAPTPAPAGHRALPASSPWSSSWCSPGSAGATAGRSPPRSRRATSTCDHLVDRPHHARRQPRPPTTDDGSRGSPRPVAPDRLDGDYRDPAPVGRRA